MGDNAKKESKKESKKENGLKVFWNGVKSEFKKITWPDKTTLVKQAVAVTIVSVVLGCIIAVLDLAIQYGVNFLTM